MNDGNSHLTLIKGVSAASTRSSFMLFVANKRNASITFTPFILRAPRAEGKVCGPSASCRVLRDKHWAQTQWRPGCLGNHRPLPCGGNKPKCQLFWEMRRKEPHFQSIAYEAHKSWSKKSWKRNSCSMRSSELYLFHETDQTQRLCATQNSQYRLWRFWQNSEKTGNWNQRSVNEVFNPFILYLKHLQFLHVLWSETVSFQSKFYIKSVC